MTGWRRLLIMASAFVSTPRTPSGLKTLINIQLSPLKVIIKAIIEKLRPFGIILDLKSIKLIVIIENIAYKTIE